MNRKHNKKLTPNAKSLRKELTPQEKKLWFQLLKDYPIRILRQKVIDNYIIDFYCAKAKLAIEIDGSQHYFKEGSEYDKTRDEMLEKRGIKTIRFSNRDIRLNFYGVCVTLDNEVKQRINPPPASPVSPFGKGD